MKEEAIAVAIGAILAFFLIFCGYIQGRSSSLADQHIRCIELGVGEENCEFIFSNK
jgi:hypothetical protein